MKWTAFNLKKKSPWHPYFPQCFPWPLKTTLGSPLCIREALGARGSHMCGFQSWLCNRQAAWLGLPPCAVSRMGTIAMLTTGTGRTRQLCVQSSRSGGMGSSFPHLPFLQLLRAKDRGSLPQNLHPSYSCPSEFCTQDAGRERF